MIRCSKQKWRLISAPDHYPEIGFERTLGRVILEIIALSGREVTLSDESKAVFSARFRKDRRIAVVQQGMLRASSSLTSHREECPWLST